MKQKKQYAYLNKLAKSNGIVLFGSTSLDAQPVNELLQGLEVSKHIYNRSISGLTLADAERCLELCVYQLSPCRVIINLGEEDLTMSAEVEQLIEQYRWILYKIHVALPKCQIVVTTVQNRGEAWERFNDGLKKLAQEVGCSFFTIPQIMLAEEYGVAFLSAVKLALYDSGMSYSEIASRAVLDYMI